MSSNKLKYFKNLDALRAFAAIAVIFAHFFDQNKVAKDTALFKLFALGNSGVSLFFVLSGFVITRILIQTVNSDNYFKSFYLRRTLRIFPLYYFALACYYFIPPLIDGSNHFELNSKQLYYVFYLQNFARTFNWDSLGPAHFWSLAVEEHFYFLWPAIVFFCLKLNLKTLINVSFFIIVLAHLLRVVMSYNGYEINVFTFTRIDQLVFGGLIAVYEKKGFLIEENKQKFIALIVIGFLGIVTIELQNSVLLKEVFKHTFFGLLYGGLIMYVVISEKSVFVNQLLQNKLIQYLGKISYGIYVWHVLAISIVNTYFSLNIYFGFILTLFITILISWGSFQIIESPFLKLKSKFNYK